jgi:hypothetical protein
VQLQSKPSISPCISPISSPIARQDKGILRRDTSSWVDLGVDFSCITVLTELTVSCQSSHRDHVRGFACCHPGLVRADCQLSESTHIAALILSEASHAIALVLSETTVSCQSLYVLSPWYCQRLLTLSPWSCQSPLSAVRVCTYSCRDLVSGFSCYCPGHVKAHRQLSESARIVAVILSEAPHAIVFTLSGLKVDYQSLYLYFTACHSNYYFRTIYVWNEIWLVLHPLYTNNNLSNWIYTIYTSSYTSSSSITVTGSHLLASGTFRSRLLITSILSICIARIFFCISSGILSHWSNRSLSILT